MLPRIDEEITFRKLEILLAFMEAGNLARAAEQLGVSTVSVHRALHSLETGTRCSLFRLEGRNLQPTDAAHAHAEVAPEVLRVISRASARRAKWPATLQSGSLGSLYSLTSRTVPALIMGLKLRKPDIKRARARLSDDLLRLRDGAIDASLMGFPEGRRISNRSCSSRRHLLRHPCRVATRAARIDLGACTEGASSA
jgi:LysR family malonate utilization transcriptional regulator